MQGSCDLKDQIKHKSDFIRERMLLPGRPPAFIVGHSIGEGMSASSSEFSVSEF